jgi:hypothetical protein
VAVPARTAAHERPQENLSPIRLVILQTVTASDEAPIAQTIDTAKNGVTLKRQTQTSELDCQLD